jgi:hypothetical protein
MFILSICSIPLLQIISCLPDHYLADHYLADHSIRCQSVVISSRGVRVPTKMPGNLASTCTPPGN